jgi:8-oxo-dGTP pyrophosphatase MutT (NUDIX family)
MPERTRLKPYETLETTRLADCRVFTVDRVRRRSGRSGRERDYFRIGAGDWVNVLALTPDDDVLLVRQERHGIEDFTLELPGGMVDPGETPAKAALRELREETGYSADEAELLGWVHPNPALQGNRCWSFLVRGATRRGDGASPLGHDDEEIELVRVPFAAMRRLTREGVITHALVVSALHLYDLSR